MPPALHITLIRPPVVQRPKSLSGYGAVPPIGLAYIAAVLRDAGHHITVIDAAGEALDQHRNIPSPVGTLLQTGLSPQEVVDRLPERVDLVGLTHMFLHEWPHIREICAGVRRARPQATVVVGGENATAFWAQILRECPAVDACVLGEGEETVVALAGRLAAGQPLAPASGLAIRGAEGPVHGGLATRIKSIDALPRPAWDLLPMEGYLSRPDPHGVHRGRSMPILATRGCPFKCTFCSSPDMWTTRYVTRDPAAVVAEMAEMVATYGVQNFNFCDLTAIVRKDWTLAFCALLDQAGLDVSWQLPTGTRSEALDAEVLQAAWRTGCKNITYAPEAGSKRMLKVLKKRVDPAALLSSLGDAHRAGMVTRVNIIVGHPAEEWADVRASLRLLLKAAAAGCDDAAVMVFAPYPGSADFRDLFAQGDVQLDDRWVYLALTRAGWSARSYHPERSAATLVGTQFGLLLAFYATAYASRPDRVARFARSLAAGQERTQLDQLVRTKLGQLRSRMRGKHRAQAQ